MSSGSENTNMANLTVECQEEGKGRCLGLGQAAYRSWHFAHPSRTAQTQRRQIFLATSKCLLLGSILLAASQKFSESSLDMPESFGEGQEATVIPRCYSSSLLFFIPNHKVEFSRSSMTGVLQQWKCRESSHPNSGFRSLGSMVCALVCFLLPW